MRRAAAGLALAALVLVPAAAAAQAPKKGSVELGAGFYYPNIDAQSGLRTPLPYEYTYGKRRGWMFRAAYSYAFFSRFGTLEAGFRAGYYRDSAHAFKIDTTTTPPTITGERSDATTAFNVIPTSLMLTYRFDWLAERYPIPFAPYARVSFERYNWWVTNAHDGTAKLGATNGFSGTAGVAFLLDFLDRQMARDLDHETGIHHTYIYGDFTWSKVDDFGSSKSWDLSDPRPSLSFGLLFVF